MTTTARKQRPPALLGVPARQQWGLVQVGLSRKDMSLQVQYPINVNPVKEPPRDDIPSLRQPISVSGYHRVVRTHMAVPALAAWDRSVVHVGNVVGHNSNRGAMRGVPTRGFTYSWNPSVSGAGPGRVQPIGGNNVTQPIASAPGVGGRRAK